MSRILVILQTADRKYLPQIYKDLVKGPLHTYPCTNQTTKKVSHIYSLLRSPHANKNSQEQFCGTIYKTTVTASFLKRDGTFIPRTRHLLSQYRWVTFKLCVEKIPLQFKTVF